jgi:hypothetical protein
MKWTTTRDAIQTALAWAYLQKSQDGGMIGKALYGCSIDKSRSNGDHALVASLEAGQICAAINAQRHTIRAWLNFAYGPEDNPHDQSQVAMEIMWKHWATVGGKWWDRYVQLCSIATMDYKVRILSEGDKQLPREIYLTGVKIHDANWTRRGWEERKSRCLETLISLDRDGIAAVSCTVKAIREQSSLQQDRQLVTTPI